MNARHTNTEKNKMMKLIRHYGFEVTENFNHEKDCIEYTVIDPSNKNGWFTKSEYALEETCSMIAETMVK